MRTARASTKASGSNVSSKQNGILLPYKWLVHCKTLHVLHLAVQSEDCDTRTQSTEHFMHKPNLIHAERHHQMTGQTVTASSGGVQNTMEIFGYRFFKTEPNQTDLKIQKLKTRFPQFGFKKPTLAFWGRFFTLSHSQFILQHDRINSQSIFLHDVSLHFSLLSHFSWQLVGPIHRRSTLFLASYTLNNTQYKKPNQKPKPRLI